MGGNPERSGRFQLLRNTIQDYWDDVLARFRSPKEWLALGIAASWAILVIVLTMLFLPDPVLPGVGRSTVQILAGFGGGLVIVNLIRWRTR